MKIGFVGDLHGRVFHSVVVMVEWQIRYKEKLDLIIQVGDFGAYPEPSDELKEKRGYDLDPSQFDFSRHVKAKGPLANRLHDIRKYFVEPIYFIRGNHEDFNWLNRLCSESEQNTISIDPFDLFHYVKDGTVLEKEGEKIACLGGVQTPDKEDPRSINEDAYLNLLNYPPGEIDVLVTHDAPYGALTNQQGQKGGSKMLLTLIETLKPKYMIGGHYHHMIGPMVFGETTYMGLNLIIYHRADELGPVKPGSFGILDMSKDEINFVTDAWLSEFDKKLDFIYYCEKLQKSASVPL